MRIRRFVNQDPVKQQNSYNQLKRWQKERVNKLKLKDYSYKVPNIEPDVTFLQNNKIQPTITWIGHSTFLIQLAGLNIVTDPVWAGQMAFRKRLAPPGVPIKDMPPIDIVLISHSHYDHLSISSLRQLKGAKQILVPAGLSVKLRLKGFTNVEEFHWWEALTIRGVKFTFVPSQHWTRRNPWDTNRSHWGGFVMEVKQSCGDQLGQVAPSREQEEAALAPYREAAVSSHEITRLTKEQVKKETPHTCCERPLVSASPTIYFAGDSGYFDGFKEIGCRFDIDVALLPIGAYEPEWFMGPQHVTPEEALQAFEDTGARWFVPMHYGAFKLADDTPREALDRLEADRCRRTIEEQRLVVLPHGETWKLTEQ
ncbi:MBL fold metallo-hydrolase [Paenibacillus sp. GSMTC-2017]|uniref:MBL fold metallo-hydrolase n=1 Tax=Paenibacillus sp. GSMTC-2017 TaxID=2794350 RepID=UPI0018D864A7|nr:MBL fold metallo-hydrolase [Paenibacillus sp. GSMTC-2017]MBH5319113.1 MBL fold metallo-hydrolase [Paenibacillus sp. GSMTC-2017]